MTNFFNASYIINSIHNSLKNLIENPVKFLTLTLLSPFSLLNYGMNWLFMNIVKSEKFNILKPSVAGLIMSFLVGLETSSFFILSLYCLEHMSHLLSFINPMFLIIEPFIALGAFFLMYNANKDYIVEWINYEIANLEPLFEYKRTSQDSIDFWNDNSESIKAVLKLALDELDIKPLINVLNEYSQSQLSEPYFWCDYFETKYKDGAYGVGSIWQQSDAVIIKNLEDKYEYSDLCCETLYNLKRIPVIVTINGREYKDNLLVLLKMMYLEKGVLRYRSNDKIKYSDIKIDQEVATLAKSIANKVNTIQSAIFHDTISQATICNDFKGVLQYLQKLESDFEFDPDVGALCWNGQMQQALDDYNANALNGKGYPVEHCCNITHKLMQNPVYVIDSKDNYKKNYYDLLPLLEWIKDYNSMYPDKSANDSIVPAGLLSQIYFDSELKNTLYETYYKSLYNSSLIFSRSIIEMVQSRGRRFGRNLNVLG